MAEACTHCGSTAFVNRIGGHFVDCPDSVVEEGEAPFGYLCDACQHLTPKPTLRCEFCQERTDDWKVVDDRHLLCGECAEYVESGLTPEEYEARHTPKSHKED